MTQFTQKDYEEAMAAAEAAGETLVDPDELTAEEQAALAEANKNKPQQTPFKFGSDDGVPEELRGKTLDDALGIYNQLKETAKSFGERLQQQQVAQPKTVVEPKAPQAPAAFKADDLIEDDGNTFNQKLQALFDAKMAPLQDLALQSAATMHRTHAIANSEILKKYTRTLDSVIQQYGVTQAQLANPATWPQLEMMVAQQHFNEIVSDRAKAQAKPPVEFSASTRAISEASTAVSLTAEERAVADGLGISHAAFAIMKQNTNQG